MNIYEFKNHIIISVINIIILLFTILFFWLGISKIIIAIILVLLGVYNIFFLSKKTKVLISPITIFSLIWLILIPLTSGSAPLMTKMSDMQWKYCLLGCLLFFIGSLFASLVNKKISKKSINNNNYKMTKLLYRICIIILLIGIGLYFLQAFINGGFPISSIDPNDARRHFYTLPGSAFISNLGFLSIYLIFCDNEYRKKKIFWLLALIYIGIQILMTVRFLLFLIVIVLLSTKSNDLLSKKGKKRIVFVILLVIVSFMIVSFYRGGVDDKQTYFINTGIYKGTSSELFKTELVRYFGMSQRTMESYITTYKTDTINLKHTLYPLLDSIKMTPELNYHYGIYGYTATNIITYFYFDAGMLWWLLMTIWSFIMNFWYFSFKRNPNNIISKYFWAISSISIVMSFYCYINAYPYWYFHYIVILLCIKLFNHNGLLYEYKEK